MKHKYFEVVLSTFTAAATLTLGRKIKFEKQKKEAKIEQRTKRHASHR